MLKRFVLLLDNDSNGSDFCRTVHDVVEDKRKKASKQNKFQSLLKSHYEEGHVSLTSFIVQISIRIFRSQIHFAEKC